MKVPDKAPHEARRLRSLQRLGMLDSEPDPFFEDTVRAASAACRTPMASVTLVDELRQWFKARVGLEDPETRRDIAFCAHAILQEQPFLVDDAATDPRFADNPLVTGAPHLRFYAGIPLRTAEGDGLGTLCVLDTVPRSLDDEQLLVLAQLARGVERHFEARLVAQEKLELADALARLELRAHRLESQLEQAHELTTDLVQTITLEGRFVFVNTRWLEVLGYPREALRSLTARAVFPSASPEGSALLRALSEGSHGPLRARARTAQGALVELEGYTGVRREAGRPTLLHSSFRLVDPSASPLRTRGSAEPREELFDSTLVELRGAHLRELLAKLEGDSEPASLVPVARELESVSRVLGMPQLSSALGQLAALCVAAPQEVPEALAEVLRLARTAG